MSQQVLIGGLADGEVVEIPDDLRYYKHTILPERGSTHTIESYLDGVRTEGYVLRHLRCGSEDIEFWAAEDLFDLGAIMHLIRCHAKSP